MIRVLFMHATDQDFGRCLDELRIARIPHVSERVESDEELTETLSRFGPDMVIYSGNAAGLRSVLRTIHDFAPQVPVILKTGQDDRADSAEAVQSGVWDIVTNEEYHRFGLVARAAARHKAAADDLERLRHQFQEQNRRRVEFVSLATHEIRGMLASVIGFAEILKEGGSDLEFDERRRFAAIIERETRRLNALAGDILEIAKIESRSLEIRRSTFNMYDLVRRVLDETNLSSSVRLTRHGAPGYAVVCADLERIRTVLTVFLEGAQTYGRGEIDLSIQCTEEAVTVCVQDNGAGIPEDEISRIFEIFHHLRSRKHSRGTGLGLTIAKGVIEAHQGKIWASTIAGSGAQFCFRLPRGSCMRTMDDEERLME